MNISLHKMHTHLSRPVDYSLRLDSRLISLNSWIGSRLSIRYLGTIHCVECGRLIKKSFNQGFCYPCFQRSPNASECIVFPEKCRGHEGIGRDIEWEKAHHVQPHIVYLSYTSGYKVGVTRETQMVHRWMDQGALIAAPLCRVPYRNLAGQIEVAMKSFVYDKTFWQRMLKMLEGPDDFLEMLSKMRQVVPDTFQDYVLHEDSVTHILYPLDVSLEKIRSLNLDKQPNYDGVLVGIKGQYLMFQDGVVFNVRKFTGYDVSIECS